MEDSLRSLDFTGEDWEVFYDTVDSAHFQDKDADLIYQVLEKKMKLISFGEYLKRYIYRKAGLTEPFAEVPLKIYQQIIRESFGDNHTPPAFEATTAKLSALSRNWLTQQTVKRKVVFLLGFGLAMSVEDVNEFLTKALREQRINAKNPFEVICWYCYKNGFSYLKYEKLVRIFEETPPNTLNLKMICSDFTIGARSAMRGIQDDAALFAFLSGLKSSDNRSSFSVTARRCFDELFDRARELAARLYNREEEERFGEEMRHYQAMLLDNERLSEAEVRERIARKREQKKVYKNIDITESDLEHIISSAIPVDRHGNLTPGKASRLNDQFAGKRFRRQHMSDILCGRAEVTRFDLITLNFFIYSQTLEEYQNAKARFLSFAEVTNQLLDRCFLGELCFSNPYECFVLMCILSEDPLGTYADVWELSYEP